MASVFIKESVSERKTVKFDLEGAHTLGIALFTLNVKENKSGVEVFVE